MPGGGGQAQNHPGASRRLSSGGPATTKASTGACQQMPQIGGIRVLMPNPRCRVSSSIGALRGSVTAGTRLEPPGGEHRQKGRITNGGRVLRDRLGLGPPRRRDHRRRRQAAGQGPHRRRPGRLRRTDGPCWPTTATIQTTRSRWPSRPPADCWWPPCARPVARSTRSTRWPLPATANAQPSPARSPTTWTFGDGCGLD